MELRWRVEFHLYSVAWLVKEVKVHASSGFDDFEDDPPAL